MSGVPTDRTAEAASYARDAGAAVGSRPMGFYHQVTWSVHQMLLPDRILLDAAGSRMGHLIGMILTRPSVAECVAFSLGLVSLAVLFVCQKRLHGGGSQEEGGPIPRVDVLSPFQFSWRHRERVSSSNSCRLKRSMQPICQSLLLELQIPASAIHPSKAGVSSKRLIPQLGPACSRGQGSVRRRCGAALLGRSEQPHRRNADWCPASLI